MQAQTFTFEGVRFLEADGQIEMNYRLDDLRFVERIHLPSTDYAEYDPEQLNAALFDLLLIGGISYYKTACPPEIKIEMGDVSEKDVEFWNRLYTKGLGEFFYENQIDFRGLVQFPVSQASEAPMVKLEHGTVNTSTRRCLVPFGGGKDSLVSVELLKKGGFDMTLFHMGEHEGVDQLAEETGYDIVHVRRELDPQLFELNAKGALNGHVPISAYIAFLTVVFAVLYGYDDIILSNEASANLGNLNFHGMDVNHQYSKSLEFEQALKEHLSGRYGDAIRYFSLLRPYHELRIAELFAENLNYLPYFSSCNRNFRILNKSGAMNWCGECPKCAFVFAILAPFLGQEELVTTFGKNLLDDEALWPLYEELLGVERAKPFECVGTPEEVRLAFQWIAEREEWADSKLVKRFIALKLPAFGEDEIERIMEMSKEHLVPEEYLKHLN